MSSIETQLENEYTWQRINLAPYFKQIGLWAVRIVLALVLPAIALAVWHYAFQKQWLPEQILPSPALVWQTTLELIDTHELQDNLWISLKRIAWSVLVGGSVGLFLGFLIGLSRIAHKFIYPTFNLIAQFPVIGWIPLLMIFLGIDESLKIAAISLAVFVPVLVATYRSVLNVPPHLLEVSQVYRFSAWQRFRRVILPSALPNIVSGLRQGIMQAWLSLVFVELLASSEGIGYLIVWGRQLIQPDIIFMAVIVIGIVGFVLDHILGWVERWFSHWQRSAF
ncbi:ABC transporter permease [Acinetobacter courvalinii]|uniref:ABC transporter permease n=1 Tax=Acinetobacter courvalinii TaxID=280147 RepID=A0AA42I4V3_9GAMM|nr:ABC transporter permease [Acinetobacter courvalinii]MDH0562578.1 ABC transporter permease [Acinetobacter courvalinii]